MKTIKNLKLGIILSFLLFPLSVNAANADNKYTFWTEDNIKSSVEKNGDSQKISLSAKGVESDYGYILVKGYFDKKEIKSGAYELWKEGVKIPFSIETQSPFYISLELEDIDGNRLQIKEDAVWGKKKEEGLYLFSFQKRQYEVKQSGEGILYIPMNCFEDNNKFQWEKLYAYCVSFVVAKENDITLEVGEMDYLSKEENVLKNLSNAQILGQEELELPVNGEAIAEYKILAGNFSLRLQENLPGVSLKGNVLRIGKDAKAGNITIEAVNSSNVIVQKTIELTEPLRDTVEFLPDFPAPEEVEAVSVPADGLQQKGVLYTIRILAGIIIAGIIAVYYIYYPRARKEQKEEM